MSFEEWTGYELSQNTLDEAAEWLFRLDAFENDKSSQLENKHMLGFYEWLESDPSHQQAYYELSELWAKSACIKEAGHLLHVSKVLKFPITQQNNKKNNSLSDASLPVFSRSSKASAAAPAHYYKASIALIIFGLFLPFFQSLV